jgi:hypothetical protein
MKNAASKTERFEMRAPSDLLRSVDDWRRHQPDLPNRSEAIRRLIEVGLNATAKSSATSSSGGSEGARKPQRQSVVTDKPATLKPPRAKPLGMSKEAQIRALRERDAG